MQRTLRTGRRSSLRKRFLQLDPFPGQVKEHNCLETTTSSPGKETETENQEPFSRPAIPVFDGGRGSVDRGTPGTEKGPQMPQDADDDVADLAARRALWGSTLPAVDRSLYYGRSYVPWTGSYL